MPIEAKRLILVDSLEAADAIGWPWPESGPGYGLLLCEEADGGRYTLTFGLEYARLLAEAGPCEIDLPTHKFPLRKEGWPAGL